jgi:hypothetical protein
MISLLLVCVMGILLILKLGGHHVLHLSKQMKGKTYTCQQMEHHGATRQKWGLHDYKLQFLGDHRSREKQLKIYWIVDWPIVGRLLLPALPSFSGGKDQRVITLRMFLGRFPCSIVFMSNLPMTCTVQPINKYSETPDMVFEPNWLQTHLGI